MNTDDKQQTLPWWWPKPTDAAWCAQKRHDYDEPGLSDEEIRERFAYGRKYAVTWDHVGDAYDEFEQLADFLMDQQNPAVAGSGASRLLDAGRNGGKS